MASIAQPPLPPKRELENQPTPVSLNHRPVILVTTVDLGENTSGTIEVLEGDDPHEVARQFCLTHGLPENIVEPLALHIWDNLEDELEYSRSCSQADEVTPLKYPHQNLADKLADASEYGHTSTITKSTARKRGPSLVHEAEATVAEVDNVLNEINNNNNKINYKNNYNNSSTADPRSIDAHNMPTSSPSKKASSPSKYPPPPQQQQQRPFLNARGARPSSANSALGTEYYGGRPYPAVSSSASKTPEEVAAAPAADRLYADFFRKQQLLDEQRRIKEIEAQLQTRQVYCTPVSRALAAHRTADGYTSYGERLYVEGKQDILRREQHAQKIREEEEAAELAAAPFKPQISKMARNLKAMAMVSSGSTSTSSSAYAGGGDYSTTGSEFSSLTGGTTMVTAHHQQLPIPSWERLHRQNAGVSTKKDIRIEMIRREQEEAELKECTFHPSIDSHSNTIVSEKKRAASNRVVPLHARLYNDARYRQDKLDMEKMRLPDEATFAPRINRSTVGVGELMLSSIDAGGGAAMEGEGGNAKQNVVDRLLQRGRQYRDRAESARKEVVSAPVDESGRELFRPRTYRGPKFARNPTNAPIGEYLYAAALDASSRAAKIAEEVQKQAQMAAGATYVNHQSEVLMEKLKRERFSAIFAYLSGQNPHHGHQHGHHQSGVSIDLLAVVRDTAFMNTIDPEVRADIEHAARILARDTEIATDNGDSTTHYGNNNESDGGNSNTNGGVEGDTDDAIEHSSAIVATTVNDTNADISLALCPTITTTATAAAAKSTPRWINESEFIVLMQEVLCKTRGVSRQYLMPMPNSNTSKKWEDPTFRPSVDPNSLQLAARSRPESIPAHELLYRVAAETQEKKQHLKKIREEADMKECLFKPVLIATAPRDTQGRALKMAGKPKKVHTAPPTMTEEDEAVLMMGQLQLQQQQRRRERLLLAARNKAAAAAVDVQNSSAGRVDPITTTTASTASTTATTTTTLDTSATKEAVSLSVAASSASALSLPPGHASFVHQSGMILQGLAAALETSPSHHHHAFLRSPLPLQVNGTQRDSIDDDDNNDNPALHFDGNDDRNSDLENVIMVDSGNTKTQDSIRNPRAAAGIHRSDDGIGDKGGATTPRKEKRISSSISDFYSANGEQHSSSAWSSGFLSGESLEDGIDAIERQINTAMLRLNMSGDAIMGTLREEQPNIRQQKEEEEIEGICDDVAASSSSNAILHVKTGTVSNDEDLRRLSSDSMFNPVGHGCELTPVCGVHYNGGGGGNATAECEMMSEEEQEEEEDIVQYVVEKI